MTQCVLLEDGSPTLVGELLPAMKVTRLALTSRYLEKLRAFSADGEFVFVAANPPRLNWLQMMAAHIIYSPLTHVAGEWKKVGPFSKDAVVALVQHGLEKDDDIIQQWFEREDVLRLLRAASTFDDLVLAVDAINGGHESRPETQKYVDRCLGSQGQEGER